MTRELENSKTYLLAKVRFLLPRLLLQQGQVDAKIGMDPFHGEMDHPDLSEELLT